MQVVLLTQHYIVLDTRKYEHEILDLIWLLAEQNLYHCAWPKLSSEAIITVTLSA
jgi:hypothetical protein